MKFIDLFAGLGGFHLALKSLGHECVFASEIDDELRKLYLENFPEMANKTFGDIRQFRDQVPSHDILCGGFPCQPFSKSGTQQGLHDEIRGTLFDEIVYILDARHPEYLILENVGNFERHDDGKTWKIVREKLKKLGYDVRGTEHITSGGSGLLSPHHFGYPHSRERFFIVGKRRKLPENPFPTVDRKRETNLYDVIQSLDQLTETDLSETKPTKQQLECIEHWGTFISRLPKDTEIPSFPIWGDEINATYPYEDCTPFAAPIETLRASLNGRIDEKHQEDRAFMLALLPNYARTEKDEFPKWKIDFIHDNREWFDDINEHLTPEWIAKLRDFPPSLRKLEWNYKIGERDIWKYVLQFRPSGLRVKRITSSPSLVAMTSTQIPFLGPERRFLTRIEGLRLQGFPEAHKLPVSRDDAFKALGNGVHVGVVEAIAFKLLGGNSLDKSQEGEKIIPILSNH
jgi:DNA (cytosine-5)-methyltransferase 1